MIALEYSLPFSNLSGEPNLHLLSIQRKEMKFPWMIFGWAVTSVACMKKNSMMVLMKVSVEENDVQVTFLHPINPSVYLLWPAIDVKCLVPVSPII